MRSRRCSPKSAPAWRVGYESRAQCSRERAPTIADYGMKLLYRKDPDGYEICLQHPVRESGE
jgi:hypothetical protein